VKNPIIFILVLCSVSFAQGKLGEQESFEGNEGTIDDPIIFSFEKDLKSLNEIMSKILSSNQLFNFPLEKPVAIPKWKRLPGRLSQIQVGEDETTFGIDSKNQIFVFKNQKWLRFPGKVHNLSVADAKNVWGLGENGQIFKLDFSKNRWIPKKGKAKYISCGFDGTVVAIYTNSDAQKYQLPIGSMVRLEKDKWLNFPGQLEKVTVAFKNDIWGIKKSGSVWHFDGERWSKMPGEMLSISVAKDKTVIGVGLNGGAYVWSGKDWINVPGINLVDIEVARNGKYLGLTSDGGVWKSDALVEEIN
jgi:hypothetical protein